MSKIIQKSGNATVVLSFISIISFIYIILLEFIIPANKILPKPSILLESIPSLFNDYNFLSAFLFTLSAIYSITVISYFLVRIGSYLLIKIIDLFPGLIKLFVMGKYFIPLFFIFLFQLWFGNSIWGEYLFALIMIMGILKESVAVQLENVKGEYIDSANSLGLDKSGIIKNVVWKSIQPKIFHSLRSNHILIWSYILVYEYVCVTSGIGAIYRTALEYNDLSLVILLIFITIITFIVMEFAFENIKKKYFFWN